MPLPIQFDWSEDDSSITFVLHVRGVKAKNVSVVLSDVYIRVNCMPGLFEVDLLHEIDTEHPKTLFKVGSDKVTASLRKRSSGLWSEFRKEGSKAELRERRQKALDEAEAREQERRKKKEEWKHEMLKAGEHEQWRLDRENREQIEKWEQEEKAKWERDVYASFDEETSGALAPAQLPPRASDDVDDAPAAASSLNDLDDLDLPESTTRETSTLAVCEVTDAEAETILAEKARKAAHAAALWPDDTEEYVAPVRENPGKIGIRFSERPRPGVPVRDRGNRAPPFPKHQVKSDQPPMVAGDEPQDESDPVWLKDKADNLMVAGDYQGAHNAYTQALKLGTNARAFANRAVASLYLGNLESCIEDCGHALRILDARQKVPAGQMQGALDPEDQKVRARVEVRLGVAYLWLGIFSKAEAHLGKAIDTEDGLLADEVAQVKRDLARVKASSAVVGTKEKADTAARRREGSEASRFYDEAIRGTQEESAVLFANRSFAHLQDGRLQECIADAEEGLRCLRLWPTARKAPDGPVRPSRLDPPYLDDPTFKHPDQLKQGEVDWILKHSGGCQKDLPAIPPEYEWVKDVAEKNDNAWIAIRRKFAKATIDAIRRATTELQDAMYTRRPLAIHQQIQVAMDQNRAGEGPSARAIRQAEEYAVKLEEHEKDTAAARAKLEEQIRLEASDFSLEDSLAALRAGRAQQGFALSHPVERTRRRLFVKILLRRARAKELLGDMSGSSADLQLVQRVEPENPEAKQRLAVLSAVAASPPMGDSSGSALPHPTEGSKGEGEGPKGEAMVKDESTPASQDVQHPSQPSAAGKQQKSPPVDDEDDEGEAVNHAATGALLASAAEYMRKNDYASALQIYNYARHSRKEWDSPLTELKTLSNTSLCLQRLRGRLPDLIAICNETLDRIAEIKADSCGSISEEMLLRMECACLSRRGSALAQQGKSDESAADAAEVAELLKRVGQLESSSKA